MSEQLGFDFGPPEPDEGTPPPQVESEVTGEVEEANPGGASLEGVAATALPEPDIRSPEEEAPAVPVEPTPPTAPPRLALRAPRRAPALVRSLAAVSSRHPRERKILVARTRGEGRELLRQLAFHQGSWVGFEVTTVLPFALELAGPQLATEGLQLLDEFDQQAILDEAMDAVLVDGDAGPLSALADGVGFRDAVRRSVVALRNAGLDAGAVRRTRLGDPAKQGAVAKILSRYRALLEKGGFVDDAGVLERAAGAVEASSGTALPVRARVLLLPGLGRLGLAGRLLSALQGAGAELLDTDPVMGLAVPRGLLWSAEEPADARSFLHSPEATPPGWLGQVDVFAASGVTDELREVLRRIGDAGLAWDEAEIVTPDPGVYGSALHVLSATLGIPVSFGVGLPVERTRPGRVVAAWFRWIEGGFGADVIRTLLAAGDLAPNRSRRWIAPARLARRLRDLRIGWGRERYLGRIEGAIGHAEEGVPLWREQPDQTARRLERTLQELTALRDILAPTLRATPRVPDRLGTQQVKVSPAQLARGLRMFLRAVPVEGNEVDETALDRLRRRLERIEATLDRRTSYRAAAAILRGHLEFRVPAPRSEGKAPWSSAGGHLYLTDLEHGGLTGRRATFIVGLDANRFPGAGRQDPLLLDDERWKLGKGSLSRSSDRLHEATFRFAALLARVRGAVTLSYSAWDPAEARVVPPAVQVLLGFRLDRRAPTATFEDLHRLLGAPAGAVPTGADLLDDRDVWLSSLSRGGRLLEGTELVRVAYPSLAAGMTALSLRTDPAPNVHNGLLSPRADSLDPRSNPDRILSASRLEALGRCPRRYLFASVLRIRVPDDPELDPERWLDALQRGALLHRVYERALRELREKGLAADQLEPVALRVLDEEAVRALDETPTPSQAIHTREMEALRRDVRAFADMALPRVDAWEALEFKFGLGDDEPVIIEVDGGTVRLRGAVDRIDRSPEGLVVIDYKTGRVRGYEPETGAFDGGRRLQNFLYTRAVAQRFEEPVARMQYDFPTHRGQNQSQGYSPAELASGSSLIGVLLDGVAAGHFFPTDDPSDCTFCDYQELCGVRETRHGLESPMADWCAEAKNLWPELQGLRRARGWKGG